MILDHSQEQLETLQDLLGKGLWPQQRDHVSLDEQEYRLDFYMSIRNTLSGVNTF